MFQSIKKSEQHCRTWIYIARSMISSRCQMHFMTTRLVTQNTTKYIIPSICERSNRRCCSLCVNCKRIRTYDLQKPVQPHIQHASRSHQRDGCGTEHRLGSTCFWYMRAHTNAHSNTRSILGNSQNSPGIPTIRGAGTTVMFVCVWNDDDCTAYTMNAIVLVACDRVWICAVVN